MPDAPRTEDDLLELGQAFYASRALLSAVDLGVFRAIDSRGAGSADLARSIGADQLALERLLDAVCSIGVLEKRDSRYFHTEVSARHLATDAPEPLALEYLSIKWDNWSLLTDAVRSGRQTVVKPFADPLSTTVGGLRVRAGRALNRLWLVAKRSDHWLWAFVNFMRDHARVRARRITELIDFEGASKALDVGGGPAVYAMAFAAAAPDLHVTVFDRPEIVPKTRKRVADAGMTERVDAVGGNFMADDLGSGFDLVFISETVHAVSSSDNQKLVGKAFAALEPGGRLVVQDFILEDDRTGPEFAALFSLEMLLTTQGGDTFSRTEVASWMTAAGFERIEV